MKVSSNFLNQIRSHFTLSQVIGRSVALKKQGREFVGLCPFHDDKNPSLTVNDQKQFYHCFSCKAHGDVFKFVMETQNLEFMEAVKMLAQEAGLKIQEETPLERKKIEAQEQDLQTLEQAGKWFEEQLNGSPAAGYLKHRGINEATIKRFRLGYAPPNSEIHSHNDPNLVRCGLVKIGENKDAYPYFRHRLMFPIFDRRNRIIAFGGRALDDDNKVKYLNSPQSNVFNKSATIYAEPNRFYKSPTYIVEGYMDVIALSMAGIGAVAPLGTAMGEKQLDAVWRYDTNPVVCFDGDDAGRAAALRLAERALPHIQAYRSLRFVMLPHNEDPDTFLRQNSSEMFKSLNPLPLVEFLWLTLSQNRTTPEERTALRAEYNRLARLITNETLAKEYARDFNEKFFNRGKKTSQKSAPPNSIAQNTAWLSKEKVWLDAIALSLIRYPELIEKVGESLARLGTIPPLLTAICEANQAACKSQAKMEEYLKSLGFDVAKIAKRHISTHVPFELDDKKELDGKKEEELEAKRQEILEGIQKMLAALSVKIAISEAQQLDAGDEKSMAVLRLTAQEIAKLNNDD